MPRRYRSRSKRRISRKSRRTKRRTKRRTRRKKGGMQPKRRRRRPAAPERPVPAPEDLPMPEPPAPRNAQQRRERVNAIEKNAKWRHREQRDPVTGWGAHNNVLCGKFGCAFKTVLEGMGDEKDFNDEAGDEWPKRFREQKIKRRIIAPTKPSFPVPLANT